MEFASELEEGQYFPYFNMSLEESRLLRYLIKNMEVFKEHEIVKMSLRKEDKEIKVNGIAYKEGDNLTFDGVAKPKSSGYVVAVAIEKVLSHKDYYSIESFNLNKGSIRVHSKIEGKAEVTKKIPYMDNYITYGKGRS